MAAIVKDRPPDRPAAVHFDGRDECRYALALADGAVGTIRVDVERAAPSTTRARSHSISKPGRSNMVSSRMLSRSTAGRGRRSCARSLRRPRQGPVGEGQLDVHLEQPPVLLHQRSRIGEDLLSARPAEVFQRRDDRQTADEPGSGHTGRSSADATEDLTGTAVLRRAPAAKPIEVERPRAEMIFSGPRTHRRR